MVMNDSVWKHIVDYMDDVIILVDHEDKIISCNKKLLLLTGLDTNGLIGKSWILVLNELGVVEDKHQIDMPEHKDLLFKNGERFHISVKIIKNSEGVIVRKLILLHNVLDLYLLRNKIQINEDNLKKREDEIDRLYLKLKESQSYIMQQEKMASIGQLAAGIAHEINNPLGFVMSNLSSLQRYSERMIEFLSEYANIEDSIVDPAKEHIFKILKDLNEKYKSLKISFILDDLGNLVNESVEGADRVKRIVEKLKGFAHMDGAEDDDCDINSVIDGSINSIWVDLKNKVELKKEYGDISHTKCNIGQLNQVFISILLNAADAINEHGKICVKTCQNGGSISVSISDTGSGIPEEILSKLFEPFFTTKDVGKGTGLGLSLSYEIIKKHNGEIKVESAPNKGTIFTIIIPVVE